MTLSPHRQHKIYIAATMGYGLGSEDPEEIAYFQKIKEELKKDRETRNLGISRSKVYSNFTQTIVNKIFPKLT